MTTEIPRAEVMSARCLMYGTLFSIPCWAVLIGIVWAAITGVMAVIG